MDHQQGFIVGVSSRGRPVEGSCDHGFVIDHGELVVQLLATCELSNYWLHHRISGGVSHPSRIEVFEDFVSG